MSIDSDVVAAAYHESGHVIISQKVGLLARSAYRKNSASKATKPESRDPDKLS